MRWGVNSIVGESFAEIFRNDCKSLGILTVTAEQESVTALPDKLKRIPTPESRFEVGNGHVIYEDRVFDVSIPNSTKEALVEGIRYTMEFLYSNMWHVHDVAESLSYVNR